MVATDRLVHPFEKAMHPIPSGQRAFYTPYRGSRRNWYAHHKGVQGVQINKTGCNKVVDSIYIRPPYTPLHPLI